MSTLVETNLAADLAALAAGLPGPAFLHQLRSSALATFAELGLPTTRHEDWRFTSLSPLLAQNYTLPDGSAKVRPDQAAAFAVPGLSATTLVFVDGRFAPESSDIRRLPDGVRVLPLHEAMQSQRPLIEARLGKLAAIEGNAFTALNTAMLGNGVLVHVPRGKVLTDPIHVLNIACDGSSPTITSPRNLIVADDNSQVDVIEHYVSLGSAPYFANAVTEFFVGDNSHAAHYFIEEDNRAAVSVSSLYARVGRAAKFDSHSVLLGGALVRNNVYPTLDGDGGHCVVNGLFVGDGEQQLDNFMFVRHMRPHCDSHQYYNGILDCQSHGVFTGRIYVDRAAQKTDAKQTSSNLLLSGDAQIDTRPQLEIYADDVKCTHGATVGQLDEDAMFYLRSRGISEKAARAMLVFAFAAETFHRMKLAPIRDMLERKMLDRLPEGEFLKSVL